MIVDAKVLWSVIVSSSRFRVLVEVVLFRVRSGFTQWIPKRECELTSFFCMIGDVVTVTT